MVAGRKPKTLHPYAWSVLKGREVVGELVDLACDRSWRDHRGDAAERGLHFDVEAAEHVLEFFSFLKHSKGEWAGQVFELEPWQEFVIWELFGWYRGDGSRRFRTGHVEVARKNGKTTLLAGIGLYLLDGDGEPGAEVYTAATKRDQARIMHDEAIRMVNGSPKLSELLDTFRSNISNPVTASKYEPLGADSSTLDGLNTHGALVDELHAHPSDELYHVLETSTSARRSPLIVRITTAGSDRMGFAYRCREDAIAVLEDVFSDDSLFAYIATLDEKDDWRDPAVWPKANPNLGVSVKPDQLAEQIDQAARSPWKQSAICRYRLNQWTDAITRWLSLDAWDACAGDLMPRQIEDELFGRVCFAGLDLSSTSDIAAFVLLFPPEDARAIRFLADREEDEDAGAADDQVEEEEAEDQVEVDELVEFEEGPEPWHVVCRFWIPGDDLEQRVKETKVPYDEWVRDGWLLATEGNVLDYRAIRREILALAERYRIREIGFDRWNITETANELEDEGFSLIEIAQNYPSMSPPMKDLERLILAALLRHGGHPILRWMASNIEVKEYAGAIKPVKPSHKAATKKIDGLVALVMALARATAPPEAAAVSPYESHGIRTV